MTVERRETELFTQVSFPARGVQTLAWQGDELVDWAGGHRVYGIDGTVGKAVFTSYGPSFDGVVAAQDGRHIAIYQRLGTKALLLRDGKLAYELDRSYYNAQAFEYPIGFVPLPGGRTGLIHCPEDYRRLEIDDVLTRERLTRGEREPKDFFHSRLAVSPSGRRFASAGWVWHPWDAVAFYDVAAVLRDPRLLDELPGTPSSRNVGLAQEIAAAWLDDELLAIAGGDEAEDPEEVKDAGNAPRLHPRGLAVFDVSAHQCLSSVVLSELTGTIMAAGRHHIVSFFGTPKLIALDTGAAVHTWSDVSSGTQASSICGYLKSQPPPLALDAARGRFAVASDERITIVELRLDRLRP